MLCYVMYVMFIMYYIGHVILCIYIMYACMYIRNIHIKWNIKSKQLTSMTHTYRHKKVISFHHTWNFLHHRNPKQMDGRQYRRSLASPEQNVSKTCQGRDSCPGRQRSHQPTGTSFGACIPLEERRNRDTFWYSPACTLNIKIMYSL